MQRDRPPYRADQVGSLLRPPKLKEVYARHGNGEASGDELARIQDESVKDLIAKQESLGLSILTDGEYRRLNFQDSFVESVAGFVPKKQTMQFQESRTVGGEALQRWVPDSGKTDPAMQYWRPLADAKRDYPAKAQRREVLNTRSILRTLRLCAFARNNPISLRLCSTISARWHNIRRGAQNRRLLRKPRKRRRTR